ncbi:MAG: class II aldolase/adducin family protein [Clostridia bacterium]|nr:class II aldolase/adducin family protein [Clostridia bacterium]
MEISEAKRLVIEAGEKLVEAGLIARTWGNVSCRVDDKTFVITPSGKPYIGLTPDDIVEVGIEDLAWSGDVKPSSEKGVHAEVYKEYPEANFVIHTHQKIASAVSTFSSGIKSIAGEAKKIIGENVLLADYGLPGTGKLKAGVTKALKLSPSKALIMAHHGTVCFGKDSAEAFEVASCLEKVCAEYILNGARVKLGIIANNLDEFCDKVAKKLAGADISTDVDKNELYNSTCDRENGRIVLTNQATGKEVYMDLKSGAANDEVSDTAKAHRSVYLASSKMNYIIHNSDRETVAVSLIGKTMKPLIDDFSQICGTKIKVAKTPKACGRAIKRKNAVLLKGKGALCCGGNEGDAQAVDMIMSKSSLAMLATKTNEPAKPINPVEALLMRVIYLKKYSKQAKK